MVANGTSGIWKIRELSGGLKEFRNWSGLGFEEADGVRNDTGIIGEDVFAATMLTSCLAVSRLHCSALGVCFVRRQQ